MAEERIKVLVMCTIVAFCLSSGSFFLKVTSDPIELWSSPDSRCRKEKDFFDTNFGPFYRTNQVFIKAVGISEVFRNVAYIYMK